MSRFGRVQLFALFASVAAFALLATTSVQLFGAAEDVPKLSSFAPIEDLVAEADELIEGLQTALADESSYQRRKRVAVRDAYILAVVSHAVAEHDKKQQVKWGDNAAVIRDAARDLAMAEGYSEAQAALGRIKELVSGGAAGGTAKELDWTEVAPIADLMPVVNRRYLLTGRDARRGRPRRREQTIRHATMIAVLARTVRDETSAVENSQDMDEWRQYADAAREKAATLAELLRKKQDDQLKDGYAGLAESCSNCHKKFRPDIE